MRLFIKDESRTAKREGRDTVFTVHNFTRWAAENLNSPRAVWLYSMGFSLGAMFVVFSAAIRSGCVLYTLCSHSFHIIRNNNIKVAKGAMYLLKSLAWSGNLPLYRKCILRSGIAEEVQAPEEMQVFLANHKFGQRKQNQCEEQQHQHTHQVGHHVPHVLRNQDVSNISFERPWTCCMRR